MHISRTSMLSLLLGLTACDPAVLVVDGIDNDPDAHRPTLHAQIYNPAQEVPSTPESGHDLDGDSYQDAEDCDDTNADVHPGAPEIDGDGVDNNCNGEVDGLSFSLTWDSSAASDGFTATISDSPGGVWTLELTYWAQNLLDEVIVEVHEFETECVAPMTEGEGGGCVGTRFDAADASRDRMTYVLVAPSGECWAWGVNPEQTGCTLEDATTW